jgi:F420-dependent oxidoreductase-like protein
MELGIHLADFTYPGGDRELAPTLVRVAKAAEAAGVARLTVMDHLWQIGVIGPPEHAMLEAYTTLGFIAANTERVLLHTLVTGVVYREPGLLAKAVSTLDVLSGGRAGLGIGAAWNEDEARGLGLPFPPTAERFERLEEAVQICLQMWSDSAQPFEGKHYQLGRTLNSPQNLTKPHPKLMIGGMGERKTLRLVAKYAGACNLFPGPDVARKLDVLRQHCQREGRDYDKIEKTATMSLDPSTDPAATLVRLRELHEVGFAAAYVMIPGTQLETMIDVLGADIIPEISSW